MQLCHGRDGVLMLTTLCNGHERVECVNGAKHAVQVVGLRRGDLHTLARGAAGALNSCAAGWKPVPDGLPGFVTL